MQKTICGNPYAPTVRFFEVFMNLGIALASSLKLLGVYMMRAIIVSSLLLVNMVTNCVDIGSDTAVARFDSQVIVNDGDRVAGFAALFGGFALSDADTRGTFDSFFPVSGSISLTGGTLILNRDLIIHDVIGIGFLGNIIGNRHIMEVPTIERIPSEGGANFRCAPIFLSQAVAGEDAETLSFNYTEEYLATAGDDGIVLVYSTANNVLTPIDSFDTGPIPAFDGTGDVRWRPGENILAFTRQANGAGNGSVWIFSFDGATLTLVDNVFFVGDGRACSWHPSGDYLAVSTLVTGAQIRVYPVDSSGNLGTVVTTALSPARTAQYESVQFDTTGNYFVVGLLTNSVNPELLVYELSFSPLTIVGINASLSIGSSIAGLDWGKGPNYLVLGLITGGATTDNIRVYSFDDGGGGVGNGSLTFLDNVNDLGRTVEGLSWEPVGECFSASTDELAGTAFFNTYAFDNSTITLIKNVTFTGLNPGDDLEATRWGPTGRFAAVSGDDDIIRLYALPAGSCYTWTDLIINEVSNTTYHDVCITFTGNNIWNGNGACIEFESTCTIDIAQNSSLMFRDMTLIGLGLDRINLLDSTSTMSFNHMQIVLDSDYMFDMGRLDVIDDVRVMGEGNSFILTSTVATHINADSRFIFDKGTTLRYAPLDGSSRDLLVLDEDSAQLVFDSASFSTSSAGLQLTKGKIMFDGICTLINEGSSSATSLELGDGLTAANNVTVRWLPASNVELMLGQFTVNNV